MKQISLILGAGFSANQGYPTAEQLNDKLKELHFDDFYISTEGEVFLKTERKKYPNLLPDQDIRKQFVTNLIIFYNEHTSKPFNYEEFYDFYNEIKSGGENLEFNYFCNEFKNQYNPKDNIQYLLTERTNKIFNQLIALFLVDKDGNRFYKPNYYNKPTFPGYTGFLNCIENWGNKGIVNIHTLNHDIFFETLNNSDWLQGNLCDGFTESGSPYYGKLFGRDKVSLSYFTNEYNGKYRLYKLHGSVDQFPFHIQNVVEIDTYVKNKYGVGLTHLYKEVGKDENIPDLNDWINNYPDFLSGTTSKILRYREPCYYEKVFKNFENNLENSESLIIVGYGCGDIEINNIIERKFDFKNKPVFIVDPFPSDNTYKFKMRFNGILRKNKLDELKIEDFINEE